MRIPKPVANQLPFFAGILLHILCSIMSYLGMLVAPFWFPPLLLATGCVVTILVTLSNIERKEDSNKDGEKHDD